MVKYTDRPEIYSPDKDVILSQATRSSLDECMARLRFHKTIYQEWNFSVVDPMGSNGDAYFMAPAQETLCWSTGWTVTDAFIYAALQNWKK